MKDSQCHTVIVMLAWPSVQARSLVNLARAWRNTFCRSMMMPPKPTRHGGLLWRIRWFFLKKGWFEARSRRCHPERRLEEGAAGIFPVKTRACRLARPWTPSMRSLVQVRVILKSKLKLSSFHKWRQSREGPWSFVVNLLWFQLLLWPKWS